MSVSCSKRHHHYCSGMPTTLPLLQRHANDTAATAAACKQHCRYCSGMRRLHVITQWLQSNGKITFLAYTHCVTVIPSRNYTQQSDNLFVYLISWLMWLALTAPSSWHEDAVQPATGHVSYSEWTWQMKGGSISIHLPAFVLVHDVVALTCCPHRADDDDNHDGHWLEVFVFAPPQPLLQCCCGADGASTNCWLISQVLPVVRVHASRRLLQTTWWFMVLFSTTWQEN